MNTSNEIINTRRIYTFDIKNNLNETNTVVLFGSNIFSDKNNFGSDDGLTVNVSDVNLGLDFENANYNISYLDMLEQSGKNTIYLSLIRTICDNKEQQYQIIYCYKSANEDPIKITPASYFSANGYSGVIKEFPCPLDFGFDKINADSYITFSVLPKQHLRIVFFGDLQQKIDATRNSVPLKTYKSNQ